MSFHVLSSNFSLATVTIAPGSNQVWKLDLNQADPVPAKVETVKDAKLLNGLTAFNDALLLAADSSLSVFYGIDLVKNESFVATDHPLMKPVASNAFLEGVNGLHFKPGTDNRELCFTGSQQFIFGCIEFGGDGKAIGLAKLVGRPRPEKGFSDINWDDFAFSEAGVAYAATERDNSVQAVFPNGQAVLIAGDLNSTSLASPTATAFG